MVAAGKNWEWGRAKSSGDAPTPAAKAFGTGQELKLGVLLLNLGGPERPEDVQPFLYNLFADPDIIRLPKLVRWLQAPIASVLAARRFVVRLLGGEGGLVSGVVSLQVAGALRALVSLRPLDDLNAEPVYMRVGSTYIPKGRKVVLHCTLFSDVNWFFIRRGFRGVRLIVVKYTWYVPGTRYCFLLLFKYQVPGTRTRMVRSFL